MDPVHVWPDPDPANQNVKNRIRIRILSISKDVSILLFHSKMFLFIYLLSGDYSKMYRTCTTSYTYNFTWPGYGSVAGENFSDLALGKRVHFYWIRIRKLMQ